MSRVNRPRSVAIRQVQGASERSPHVDQLVSTRGVVTALGKDGFWMQDPKGASQASSGIFVHAEPGKLEPGDEVSVTATVREATGDWAPEHALAETQLDDVQQLSVLSKGHKLPDAVELPVVGTPEQMRAEWERFEGMRVTVPRSRVLGPERYRSVNVEAGPGMPIEIGTGAARIGARLGPGDDLSEVTGVLTYRAGLFQVEAQSIGAIAPSDAPLKPQTTSLKGDERHVTIATFNVENLDAHYERAAKTLSGRSDDDVGSGKFLGLAGDIVSGLASPDIVALQEMQDSDGTERTEVVDAQRTAQMLINHILALGGPEYTYVERPPEPNQDGGQPGGNIRVGFLYRADRVSLVDDSVERVGEGEPAFGRTRKTLHAAFEFPNPDGGAPKRLSLYNNHLSSKSGSSAIVGDAPEFDPAASARAAQADLVATRAGDDAEQNTGDVVVALGDFNDFEDSPAVKAFTDRGFSHFAAGVDEAERYSHYYRGHKGLIDHVLVKNAAGIEGELVHRNAMFDKRSSDHDPGIVRIALFPEAAS